ncbi:PDZ and LIM domain protein 2 isoform X1 [Molothrus aeneus]|uniref:PDZ and LIM domain protein 2 isoform X1 n=2 Tax=Molothrus aeneus TaxID=84833 RepID=UPI003457873B
MGCPAPPGCAGMGGMGSGVDLGGAAAHSHPSHWSPGLRRSPGCHGDPVPPPGDPQRPSPLWICCGMKDWGCWSSLGVGRCCGAAEPVPRCHILPSKPHWLGSARPQRRPCCQGFTNFLPCSSSWERPWLSQLHRRVPGTPGEGAASPGGQEEEAVAADTLRGPGSPPRKENAAGAGDPRGAAGTGRPSLCGLWVGGGGVPSASSPQHPGSLTPRSCPPRAAAAMPVTVTLPGPAPWGFRISGGRDFRKPITVSKVTEHGKAAAGDLRPGDVIVTINGESTAEMLNVEAQNKIKQSPGQLRLEVERSPVPYPSHTNGDASLEGLATRFQDTLLMPSESQSALRTLDPSLASLSASSQPLEQELTCPGLRQERRLSRQSSSQGPVLPPPPRPPSPELGAPQTPWAAPGGRRLSSPCASTCLSQGSEPAMRRLEEDSEVYKMLQENRELRAAPRQSSTFRLLQEALEDEEGGGPAGPFPSRLSAGARRPVAGVQKLHVCEKCGSSIATQAVRIQDGRYRHPSCYTCADCGLSLKMRGHFWVGDELFCEKHARLRYQGPPGAPVPRPVSPPVSPRS